MRQILAMTVAVSLASLAVAEETSVEIPLKDVWALQMPGTRDVRELDPPPPSGAISDTAISKIGVTLIHRTTERAKAGPCFIVEGEGKEALRNTVKVIVEGTAPERTLPSGKKLTLVFFSHAAPGYVSLSSVGRTGREITINFKVTIHQSSNVTVHFALIPLGKLPPGRIAAKLVEVASVTPYSNHDLTDRAVSDACEFVVR